MMNPVTSGSVEVANIQWGNLGGRFFTSFNISSFSPLSDFPNPNQSFKDFGPIVRLGSPMAAFGSSAFTLIGVVPDGFRGWLTNGIRWLYDVEGVNLPADTVDKTTLTVIDPVTGGILAEDQIIEPVGNPVPNYPRQLQITQDQLGDDWKPGYPIVLQFQLRHDSGSAAGAGILAWILGPLFFDWAT